MHRIATLTIAAILLTGCATLPDWDECTKASCWNGANASQRMMNMVSPHMPDDVFSSYLNWMKDRGCNTAHLIIANKADGQYAGYCLYGMTWDWGIDEHFVGVMKKRIEKLREKGFAVVIWLMTDDSSSWARTAAQDFQRYLNDVKNTGLLDEASTVVVGLELNEYWNAGQVQAIVNATRNVYDGKIGTHHTSGRIDFAGMGDVLFYQVNPGKSAEWIQAEAARIHGGTGMPLNFFEIERSPDRNKSEAAMRGGAFAVGNW